MCSESLPPDVGRESESGRRTAGNNHQDVAFCNAARYFMAQRIARRSGVKIDHFAAQTPQSWSKARNSVRNRQRVPAHVRLWSGTRSTVAFDVGKRSTALLSQHVQVSTAYLHKINILERLMRTQLKQFLNHTGLFVTRLHASILEFNERMFIYIGRRYPQIDPQEAKISLCSSPLQSISWCGNWSAGTIAVGPRTGGTGPFFASTAKGRRGRSKIWSKFGIMPKSDLVKMDWWQS